jgi:prevent-host-death family protein
MTETSVADAKNNLPKLLHRVESGDAVHITRRGKPVAVLLSQAEYARLTAHRQHRGFWEQIVAMRADPDFEPLDLTPEEVDSWRDRDPGRDFQWPD